MNYETERCCKLIMVPKHRAALCKFRNNCQTLLQYSLDSDGSPVKLTFKQMFFMFNLFYVTLFS